MSSSSAGPARPAAPRAGRGRASSTRRAKSAQKDAKVAPARSARAGASLEQRLLLTCTLCLLAFGLVMVYSATSATTVLQGGSGGSELIKFAVFAAVGLVAMRLLARHGIARVQGIVAPLLVLSFVLVLAVHVPGLGVSVNGARRWLGHGSLVFQPSELLKIALVLYAATLIARRPGRLLDLKDLTKPLLLVVGGACLLVASQPDIGTAMVIAFTIAAMLIAAGIPMRNLGIIAGTVAALVVLYALAEPYARQRLTSFLNPWAHASGSGFQAVQGQIAIGSGGLFGVGPGRSVQKIFYLPEALHRLHPGRDRGRARRGRHLRAALPLRGDRLRRPAGRAHGAQPAQRADRRRHDFADRLRGDPERIRGAGVGATDGSAVAVRLSWREQPDRDARRDGAADERRRRWQRSCARGARQAGAP